MLSTDTTMAEAFWQVAESHSNQEAIVCGELRTTYGQLLNRIGALSQSLHRLGVGKGDRIVTLLSPGPEFATLFFAVARLGAVIVPLNPQTRPRGLDDVLGDAEPIALVTQRPVNRESLHQAANLRHVIFAGEEREHHLSLANLWVPDEASYLPPDDVSPQDLLALLYTSGTTGRPKGTMHNHRTLIAPVVSSIKLRELWIRRPSLRTLGQTAKALARYRERLLRTAGQPQTFLSTVGWHTITGLEAMLQGLLMGDRLVVMPRFHPREALQLIEQERVTILIAVPMALQVMLGVQEIERYDTSSLLICGTGAAPCPPRLARDVQQCLGCAIHIGFGATETAGGIAATSLADSDERQSETVGRAMPGIEIRIVDDQHRKVPPGQVGELACRSDSVMLGYYHAPEATAEVMDEDGWYYTGDLATMDEKGYLRIVGRKKDMIIRGGQNVYPAEIETYLAGHSKIREAAVVGVPAAVGGESAWAFVILEDGAVMSAQEVLDYCRAALEPYKIPARVRFVTGFPRSQTGKPQKFKLQAMALQEGGEPQ